jgi:hypothetical protein
MAGLVRPPHQARDHGRRARPRRAARRLGLSLAIVAAALFLVTGSAFAAGTRALTAPAYAGNTLNLSHDGPIVAGTIARVNISGHADWGAPTDDLTTPYDLYMFVQNAESGLECAPWYGEQLQASINLGLSASSSISGWVMQGDLAISPAPPASGIDWSGETVPFSIKPGLGSKVLLCAYQRYIIDDVATYQLPVRVEQPRCAPKAHAIRRGAKLVLRCNLSGPIRVRFRGPTSRTVKGKVDKKTGLARVPTGGLRPGSYKVDATVGELGAGSGMKLRVRR